MKKTCALLSLFLLAATAFAFDGIEELKKMEGFSIKNNSGLVRPIEDPSYTPITKAAIPADAMAMGIAGDKAEIVSLNLLIKYFVVNRKNVATPYSLIWDPFSNAGAAYESTVDGRVLSFAVFGAFYNGSLVLIDATTQSYWSVATGKCLAGPLKGKTLKRFPGLVRQSVMDWKALSQEVSVLVNEGVAHIGTNPFLGFFTSPSLMEPVEKYTQKLPPKTAIFAFEWEGKSYAIAHAAIFGGWKGKVGNDQMIFYREKDDSAFESTRVYLLEDAKPRERQGVWSDKKEGDLDFDKGLFRGSNKVLKRVDGIETFWYVWDSQNDKVKLLNPPRRGFSEFQKQEAAPLGSDDPFDSQ